MPSSSTHTLTVQLAGNAAPLAAASQQGQQSLQQLQTTGTHVGSSLHATFSNVGARIGSSFRVGVGGLAAIGATAGAAAGGALVKGILGAMDVEEANAKLKAQLGLNEQESARLGSIAGKVYAGNYGDSLGNVNDAIRSVVLNIDGLRGASKERLQGITGDVLSVSNAFDQDLGGVTRAVGQLMRTGLAKDSQDALNIVTKGFQTGADKADDFLDTLNEYGTQFRKLGIDGATATGIISQGLKAGARDGDLVADSIKEFSIRAVDGSATTKQGFEALGLSAQKMGEQIGKGGGPARKGLDEVLDRLRGIKDPVKQSQAAVALFGTQAEDLGKALYAIDPSKAAKGIGAVGGAARKVNNDLSTTKGGIETFKRQISLIADNVGKQFLPYINKAVTAVNGFIQGMTSGKGSGGQFADTVRKIAGTVSSVVGKVIEFGKQLRESFSGGDNGASSSIQKIIANVRELVRVVVPFVKNLASQIKVSFNGMSGDLASIGRAWLKVQAATSDVVLFVAKRILPIMADGFKGTASVIRGIVRVISGILSGDFTKAWSGLKDIVDGQLKLVKTTIRGAWSLLGPAMASLGKYLIRQLLAGLEALPGLLKDALVAGIKVSTRDAPELLVKVLSGLGEKIAKGIIGGLGSLGHLILDKLKSALGWVADQAKGLGGAVGKVLGLGDGIGTSIPTNVPAFGGGLQGANPALGPIASIGQRFGLHVSSGRRPGSITSSGNISYHSTGEAIDEADGIQGPSAAKLGYFNYLKSTWGSRLAELIYTPGGVGIKNGRPFQYTGQVAADHLDHVHVALDTGAPGVGDGIGESARAGSKYFSGQTLVNMLAIAGRESNYVHGAHNYDPPRDDSWGDLQINVLPNANPQFKSWNLKNPDVNWHAGSILYKGSGYGPWGGRGVSPFHGVTATMFSRARAAVAALAGGGGTTSTGATGSSPAAKYPGPTTFATTTGGNTASGLATTAGASGGGPGVGPKGAQRTYAGRIEALDLAKANAGDDPKKLAQVVFAEMVEKRRRLDKIKKALKGKLRPATRSRLTQEAISLMDELNALSDLAADITDGTPVGEGPAEPASADSSSPGTTDTGATDTGAATTSASDTSVADLAAALRDLQVEVKRQTDFAEAVKSTNEFQLTKNLSDLLSGYIVGRGVAGRAFTPGNGTAYAY